MDFLFKRVVVRKKLWDSQTWVPESEGFVLEDTFNEKVSINIGKKRDSFNFDVLNTNNKLFETYFSGDGVTKDFTLEFYPIPTEHLSGNQQKFFVYVDGSLQEYSSDYTVTNNTLSFTTAPSSGTRNIRVVYPVIEAGDLVDIYFWKNKPWSSLSNSEVNLARKIEGRVIEPKVSKGKNIVSVRGYGIIDSIFAGMAFALYDKDTYNKSHLIIQQIISQLNKFNPSQPIKGQDSTEWSAIGNDTSTKTIQYSSKYRTAIEMIEELSSDRYTGNGQYIYWVAYNPDSDAYEFHWKAKPSTVTDTITEGVHPSKIDVGKSDEEVVNVVIANVGNDCYGNGQEYLYYNFSLTGKGARWKYISETSTITQDILNAEFQADIEFGGSNWEVGEEGERVSNFPKSTAYPYTFKSIYARDDSGNVTTNTITVNNDKEFNEAIRTEARARGNEKVQPILEQYGNARYKATLFIPYSSDFTPTLGEIYQLNLPSFGLIEKKLRLVQIDYEFYGMQLNLEEDEVTMTT